MSTLRVTNLVQSSSGTNNIVLDDKGNATVANTLVMGSSFKRNKIINGDMRVDQRGVGTAGLTSAGGNFYGLDRWQQLSAGPASGKFSVKNTPSTTETGYATRISAGFNNYLAITSLTSYSIAAGDIQGVSQAIEGYNIADLAWGTSGAKTVTLSFWVYSSLTGTFGGSILNYASTYSYPFTYTIIAANTWEQKTITIVGPTAGAWLTTNGVGAYVNFSIGTGSTYSGTAGSWAATGYYSATGATNVTGTNGATFYITGVQLEVGSVATPYERQIYSDQLVQCQRYYELSDSVDTSLFWSGNTSNGNTYYWPVKYAVTKRAAPTVAVSSVSASGFGTTLTIVSTSTVGFRADNVANATASASYYRGNWTASAEL